MKKISHRYVRKTAAGVVALSMLCAAAIPSVLAMPAGAASASGDLNGDGSVTAADVAILQTSLLGGTALTAEQYANADVTGDGAVDGLDLTRLRQMAAVVPVSDAIAIHLSDSGITVEGDTKGVTAVSGKAVTISASGNYTVDGSITDGQIFVESGLFAAGMRPAVNVGLSVSRVGGAAQTKAMKKASGSIRIDLAQYREMEVFTQFSSDLDPATKEQLEYGSGLMELLKQPLYHPMSLHEKVITLCAATHKIFLGIDKKEIRQFRLDLMTWFDTKYPNIGEEIEEKKVLSDELIDQIVLIAEEFKKSR